VNPGASAKKEAAHRLRCCDNDGLLDHL